MHKSKTLNNSPNKEYSALRLSALSSQTGFERLTNCSSPIRVIGFRNFTPSNEFKGFDQRSKSIVFPSASTRSSFSINLIGSSPTKRSSEVMKPSRPVGRSFSVNPEVFEMGPFIIFTPSDSSEDCCFRTLETLEHVQLIFEDLSQDTSADRTVSEINLSNIRIREFDCVYIISKELLALKMSFYSLSEKTWKQFLVSEFKSRIDEVNDLTKSRRPAKQDDLVVINPISTNIFGKIYRSFDKGTRTCYGLQKIDIKTPEALCLLCHELEVATKILESNFPNLLSIASVQFVEQEKNGHASLHIVLDLGLGTLQDFSVSQILSNEEWQEGELLRTLIGLLKLKNIMNSLDISIGDISISNIVIDQSNKQLRVLDLSTSHTESKDSNVKKIEGRPRYMAPEVLHSLKKPKSLEVDDFLTDLYSIGVLLVDLANSSRANTSREELLSYDNLEKLGQKYPTLYDFYLTKLLSNYPTSRKDALHSIKPVFNEAILSEERKNALEKHTLQRLFISRPEFLYDIDTFLPYLWQIKDFELIQEMEKKILKAFKASECSFKRVKKFFERLISLCEGEKLTGRTTEMLNRFILFVEAENSSENKSDKEDFDLLLLELYQKIAVLYKQEADYNKALESYEKASYYETLRDGGEGLFENFSSQFEIAYLYEKLGHDALALDNYIRIQNKFRGSFKPDTNQLQEAKIHERLGAIYYRRGELLAAVDEATHAITGFTTCYGFNHEAVANCERLLGDIFMKSGDEEEAVQHYNNYFSIYTHSNNKYDAQVGDLMLQVANYYKSRKEYDYAIESYEKALHIYEYNEDKSKVCVVYEDLAESYTQKRRYMLAVKNLRSLYKIKLNLCGEHDKQLVPVLERIIYNLLKEGENTEALNEYSKIINILVLYRPEEDVHLENILRRMISITTSSSPTYKNSKRFSILDAGKGQKSIKGTKDPLLISVGQVEDVRGAIENFDLELTLESVRELIYKKYAHLQLTKYKFTQNKKAVDIIDEGSITVKSCVVTADGLNYILIKM